MFCREKKTSENDADKGQTDSANANSDSLYYIQYLCVKSLMYKLFTLFVFTTWNQVS